MKTCIIRFPIKLCILGTNPTWSWCIILLICFWILSYDFTEDFCISCYKCSSPLVRGFPSLSLTSHWPPLSHSCCMERWGAASYSWVPGDLSKNQDASFGGGRGEWTLGSTKSFYPGTIVDEGPETQEGSFTHSGSHSKSVPELSLKLGLPDCRGTHSNNIKNILW